MSSMQQQPLRPWAELPMGNGQNNPAPEQRPTDEGVLALFRRVEVPVKFNSDRVALALFQRRPAPAPWRPLLVAASVLLMGSAGAVAAVRQIPSLNLWLMTKASTRPPTSRAAEARVSQPATLAAAAEPPVAVAEAPAPQAEPARLAVQPAPRTYRRYNQLPRRRLAIAKPSRAILASLPAERSPATEVPAPVDPLAAPLEAPSLPAAPAPEAESPLARETRMLNQASTQMNGGNDPAAALDTLNQYQELYPLGLMSKEATTFRVQALQRLKRSGEALAVLRSFPFGDGAIDMELRVLRGELSAERSCQDAIADFTTVAEASPPDPLLERALFGRAACEARLGRRPEAEVSFRAYLRQFPAGKFAAVARQQLGDQSK